MLDARRIFWPLAAILAVAEAQYPAIAGGPPYATAEGSSYAGLSPHDTRRVPSVHGAGESPYVPGGATRYATTRAPYVHPTRGSPYANDPLIVTTKQPAAAPAYQILSQAPVYGDEAQLFRSLKPTYQAQASAYSAPTSSQQPAVASALGEIRQTFVGTNYQTSDGQQRTENVDEQGNIRGQYSYVDPNGRPLTVKYSAGKDGFHVEGDHIPKVPGVSSPSSQPELNAQPQYRYQPQLSGRSLLDAQPQFRTQPLLTDLAQINVQPKSQAQPQSQYELGGLSQPQYNLQPQYRAQPQPQYELGALSQSQYNVQAQYNAQPQQQSTVESVPQYKLPQSSQLPNSHTQALFNSVAQPQYTSPPQPQYTPQSRSQYSLQEQTRYNPQIPPQSLFSRIQSLSRSSQPQSSELASIFDAQPPQQSQALPESLLNVSPQRFPPIQSASALGSQPQVQPSPALYGARYVSKPQESSASTLQSLPGAYNLELTL